MKVVVKKDVCIGCGACTVIADQVFEIDDDGLAKVIKEFENIEIIQEEIDNVQDAADSCPVGAIETEE